MEKWVWLVDRYHLVEDANNRSQYYDYILVGGVSTFAGMTTED